GHEPLLATMTAKEVLQIPTAAGSLPGPVSTPLPSVNSIHANNPDTFENVCPQVSELIPKRNFDIWESLTVDWLSKAVQIPTESYDYYGSVGTDPRWEKFHAFHAYLEQAFPLIRIWGRGSCDDKSGVIGIMAAIETMLAGGYEPTRTVVLAFGFDEESRGTHGAKTLAVKLEEMFGANGYAMLVDEGSGYNEQYGRVIATPSIAEKGYLDIQIEVTTPGGHSSLPPPHTVSNPFKAQLQLRAAEDTLFSDLAFKNLVGTTRAIDIVRGGVKVNALPEQAWAVVNHRISTESSISRSKASDIELLKALASEFNLAYTAFGETITPVTPTEGDDADRSRRRFNKYRGIEGDDGTVIVSPGLMSGNTDTTYYWRLTPHIIRYGHIMKGSSYCMIHTTNEAMLIDNFVEIIQYFTALMLNVDESVLS
ncbi:carboxypeptidase S, partial [Pisolithus sp. B1]